LSVLAEKAVVLQPEGNWRSLCSRDDWVYRREILNAPFEAIIDANHRAVAGDQNTGTHFRQRMLDDNRR